MTVIRTTPMPCWQSRVHLCAAMYWTELGSADLLELLPRLLRHPLLRVDLRHVVAAIDDDARLLAGLLVGKLLVALGRRQPLALLVELHRLVEIRRLERAIPLLLEEVRSVASSKKITSIQACQKRNSESVTERLREVQRAREMTTMLMMKNSRLQSLVRIHIPGLWDVLK
jgi:hypothetical protein